MAKVNTFKVNCMGGIISPGDLLQILEAAQEAHVQQVSIGLRQQLLIQVLPEHTALFSKLLLNLNFRFEINDAQYPNVVSSYPAEEIFITKTWLSEGVYKDIFDLIDDEPRLKINISDSNQSFTPLLTGNINWVASLTSAHFWHLFIRFPKTNTIYEWNQLTYTNDIAQMSKHIENIILSSGNLFYDNEKADGEVLFQQILKQPYITKPAEEAAQLPQFNLPYYEGLNKYNDKIWLGIYRRNELFDIDFLKDVCALCLNTKIGQICSTPWKSLIVKGIEEKDRHYWNALLAKHQINMRHAANELNFQIEDCCEEGLALKMECINHFSKNDTRTFGVCIGIKTRKKTETFSSILVKRKPVLLLNKWEVGYKFDILVAKNFNPNERTEQVFVENITQKALPQYLQKAVELYNQQKGTEQKTASEHVVVPTMHPTTEYVYQCGQCYTVYDEKVGDEIANIPAGTAFNDLPKHYTCQLCDAPLESFHQVNKSSLHIAC